MKLDSKEIVSIVIPVYNGEKTIKRTIESIIRQTYSNLDIVIVNDGSVDNTIDVIRTIKDDRINLINIGNSGVSTARNIGIENSKGQYIMFVDADDYIEDNAVEKLLEIMNDEDIDIIRFNGFIENNNVVKKIEYNIDDNFELNTSSDEKKKVLINLFFAPDISLRGYCWLLFMKNIYINPFNKNMTYLEDKLFCLENMINNKKILFTNVHLYHYVYNENSKTKSIDKFLDNMMDIASTEKYFVELFDKYDIKEKQMLRINYIILLLYRMDYYIKYTNFTKTKKIVKRLEEVLRFDNTKEYRINKFKKIQLLLLKHKFYYAFYLITKLKGMVKR